MHKAKPVCMTTNMVRSSFRNLVELIRYEGLGHSFVFVREQLFITDMLSQIIIAGCKFTVHSTTYETICNVFSFSVASGPSKALIFNVKLAPQMKQKAEKKTPKTGHAALKQQLKLCSTQQQSLYIYSSACNTSDPPFGGVLFLTRAAAGRCLCFVPQCFALLSRESEQNGPGIFSRAASFNFWLYFHNAFTYRDFLIFLYLYQKNTIMSWKWFRMNVKTESGLSVRKWGKLSVMTWMTISFIVFLWTVYFNTEGWGEELEVISLLPVQQHRQVHQKVTFFRASVLPRLGSHVFSRLV